MGWRKPTAEDAAAELGWRGLHKNYLTLKARLDRRGSGGDLGDRSWKDRRGGKGGLTYVGRATKEHNARAALGVHSAAEPQSQGRPAAAGLQVAG